MHSASSALNTTRGAMQTEEFGHNENVPNSGLFAVFSKFGIPKRILNFMSDEQRMDTKDQTMKLTKELIVKRFGQDRTPLNLNLNTPPLEWTRP